MQYLELRPNVRMVEQSLDFVSIRRQLSHHSYGCRILVH
jgi:hypothetical protein